MTLYIDTSYDNIICVIESDADIIFSILSSYEEHFQHHALFWMWFSVCLQPGKRHQNS